MQLSKKQEAALLKVYETWWNSYLNGDVKTYDSFLDDDYHFVGSTNEEEYLNRKNTTAFFKATADQLAGKAELRNVKRTIDELDGGLILITDVADAYVISEPEWVFYSRFRFTSLMKETKDGWRFIYQHFSAPDTKAQEGETLGTEQITKENQELRDAIKRRTVELEHKTRELEIEASLERVRAKTMAMHTTSELQSVIHTVHQELLKLNIGINGGSFIAINGEIDKELHCWGSGGTAETSDEVYIPYYGKRFYTTLVKGIKKGPGFFTEAYTQKEKRDFFTFLLKHAPWSGLPAKEQKEILSTPGGYTRSCCVSKHTSIFIINHFGEKFSEAENEILKQFGKVFEQSYSRFLDLKKAEAQAKEAEIELAMERVRSRSMGMQKSEELKEVIKIVYQQLIHLKINLDHAGFVVDYTPKGDWHFWIADEQDIPAKITHPYFKSVWANQFNEAKEKGDDFFATLLNFEEKNKFYKELLSYVPGLPKAAKEFYLSCPGLAASTVLLENVGLYIENFFGTPYTDEENKTLMRFGKVFQQTYTRFLDLQKAEVQARESQIEAALERVRSRTMAMQRSDELLDVASILFQQVKALGVPQWNCGFNIWNPGDKEFTYYPGAPDGVISPSPCKIPLTEHPVFMRFDESRKKGEELLVYEKKGGEQEDHYRYMLLLPGVGDLLRSMLDAGFTLPTFQIDHVANFAYGNLIFITFEHFPEMHDVFKRFAKVFEQTYTRFLDLQKAEAQAREAQIEAALERTRTQSMLMQHSEQLDDTLRVFHEQVLLLGIPSAFSFLWLPDEKNDRHIFWAAWEEKNSFKSKAINYPLNRDEPATAQCLVDWKGKEPVVSYHVPPAGVEGYFAAWQELLAGVKKLKPEYFSNGLYYAEAFIKYGCFGVMVENELAEDEKKILLRFATEFERTYTRFLDLQKAEAQAREAQIEASLERVRARSMAMHNSRELSDVINVVSEQLQQLNIRFDHVSFAINSDAEDYHFWTALYGKPHPYELKVPYLDNPIANRAKEVRAKGLKFYQDTLTPEENRLWLEHAFKYNPPDYLSPEEKIYVLSSGFSRSLAIMPNIILAVGNYASKSYSEDVNDIIKRFAAVFEQSYTRFLDLQKAEAQALRAEQDLIEIKLARKKAEEALTELQTTQKQLIQSEKMASLGELTAGIAHEIQNPLNFVNNFSEVSKELLDEMKEEMEKGNAGEVKEIADDVIQNLEKILHHGKRADAIVKGMLQHSRSSTATKEPTDINKLADEYLRLAYHGLRAKDKSFNATMKTDFDETIGNINIIPQDIGRVILNLITNAFYAAPLPPEGGFPDSDYKHNPTVWVSTKKVGDKILISVRDNGPGIPKKILDKIFQPFFTTKPTGKGTGLGLSLSYDIVKAHGGELKVETKEGEGSKFVIQLPLA